MINEIQFDKHFTQPIINYAEHGKNPIQSHRKTVDMFILDHKKIRVTHSYIQY